MSSVLPFRSKRCAFDDGLTKLMGEAFEAAYREVIDQPLPAIVHEVLAKRIIDAVIRGERDPERLRDRALSALRPPHHNGLSDVS